jgi:hypothetical protein
MSRRRVALVGVALACALGVAGCGGSSSRLIPAANAVTLGDDLTALSTALENHDCNATTVGLDQLQADIGALPPSVDTRLRNNLINGENTLATHAPRQCRPTQHSTGPTGPTGSDTGPTGPDTGTSTSPQGGTTAPDGQSTSTTGPVTGTSTSPAGPTGPTNPTVGPGGGDQAPPGNTGTSGATAASAGSTG